MPTPCQSQTEILTSKMPILTVTNANVKSLNPCSSVLIRGFLEPAFNSLTAR
jgi:hypothetical protein